MNDCLGLSVGCQWNYLTKLSRIFMKKNVWQLKFVECLPSC